MYKGKRILIVVPARGGSKGIPLKNLRTVNNKPLIGLVGEVVKHISMVDRAVVSTDNEKIASVAIEYGLDAPFRRPLDISGDFIGDIQVLTHALLETEKNDGVQYDVVVMLQPTSPLRKPGHVSATIEKLIDESFDAVWTISESDSKSHPLKQLVFEDDALDYYDRKGKDIIARQQLTPVFYRNGAAYAITRDCLLESKVLMGKQTGAVLIDEEMVSIDTEWDIELIDFILSRNRV